jgi:hypothetical protein
MAAEPDYRLRAQPAHQLMGARPQASGAGGVPDGTGRFGQTVAQQGGIAVDLDQPDPELAAAFARDGGSSGSAGCWYAGRVAQPL